MSVRGGSCVIGMSLTGGISIGFPTERNDGIRKTVKGYHGNYTSGITTIDG
jgi:hypothetical protein